MSERKKALALAEKLQDALGKLYNDADSPRIHEGRAYDAAAVAVSNLRQLVVSS